MKMLIDGRYYTEQEISQYFHDYAAQCNRLADKVDELKETIKHLDSKNYTLAEKLEEIGTAYNEQVSLVGWHEEREKEYKRLLKQAAEDFRKLGDNGNGCLYTGACVDCPLYKDESSECRCWNRETEALDLIGEEP